MNPNILALGTGRLNPDILVLGIGRSGTSFVSGVLHDHLGVCMGHDFIRVRNNKDSRPNSYECKDMWPLTKDVTRNEDTLASMEPWLNKFYQVHRDCGGKLLCGNKGTHLAKLQPKQLIELNPKLVVRTYRRRVDVIDSCCRVRHRVQRRKKHKALKEKEFEEFYDDGEKQLMSLELNVKDRIKFVWIHIPNIGSPRLTEEDVISILSPYINKMMKSYKEIYPLQDAELYL